MFNPLNFDTGGNNSETSTSERDNDENLINDNEGNNSTNNNSYDLPVVTLDFVINEINCISVKKANGPDDVSIKLLKIACKVPNVIKS